LTILKPHHINDQHYNILRILKGQHPKSVCPGYIKSVLLNKRGDLTRLVDKLYRKGYIDRSTNPVNRRKVDLNITAAGLSLLNVLQRKINSYEQIQQKITQEEANLLNELLDKLR
jgi:DNA-binding MarR family transcriptional regulator